MKCPNDGSLLQAGQAEDHTGYGCTTCGGSWLPKRYIDAIQYTKAFDPKTFFSELSAHSTAQKNCMCPSNCGHLNGLQENQGISCCAVCLGVWFEQRALTTQLKQYRNKDSSLSLADIPNTTVGIVDALGALFK